MSVTRYLKLLRKIINLIRFLGWYNAVKYFAFFITGNRSEITIETTIGAVVLRNNKSDIKVLYSSAVDEYPKLAMLINSKIDFYDFGGYTGLSALSANHFLQIDRTFIFEPITDNYKILHKNIQNIADAHTFQFGIGSDYAEIEFLAQPGEDWGWSAFNVVDENFTKSEVIKLKPLSSIQVDKSKVNFAKFDIEGSEICLLEKSNFETLLRFDLILIEFHESRVPGVTNRIVSALSDRYDLSKIGDEKILFFKKSLKMSHTVKHLES